jgi:hypothetical protein
LQAGLAQDNSLRVREVQFLLQEVAQPGSFWCLPLLFEHGSPLVNVALKAQEIPVEVMEWGAMSRSGLASGARVPLRLAHEVLIWTALSHSGQAGQEAENYGEG